MAKPRGKPFVAGHDPRRHVFTREERRRGFASMMAKPMPSRLRAAIRKKIKRDLAGKPNHTAAEALEAHRRVYDDAIPF
jgi:hypothetical protein